MDHQMIINAKFGFNEVSEKNNFFVFLFGPMLKLFSVAAAILDFQSIQKIDILLQTIKGKLQLSLFSNGLMAVCQSDITMKGNHQ